MEARQLPGATSRLLPARLRARRAERVIADWPLPAHIFRKVGKRYVVATSPGARGDVELALREWFICCAWRGRKSLGMPSRLVDEAWHAFILDSVAYMTFCNAVYGSYLHHFPEDSAASGDPSALTNTVWAWDRSATGREHESLLWDLDARHGIEDAWGIPERDLDGIRAGLRATGGAGGGCGVGAVPGDGAGDAGSGDAGGGCGGGGCGGGGGG